MIYYLNNTRSWRRISGIYETVSFTLEQFLTSYHQQQLPSYLQSNLKQYSRNYQQISISKIILISTLKMVQLSTMTIILTSVLSTLVAAKSCKRGGIYCGKSLLDRGKLSSLFFHSSFLSRPQSRISLPPIDQFPKPQTSAIPSPTTQVFKRT